MGVVLMDPLTMLAALGPLALDLGKSLIGRFIQKDDYKPVSIAEWMQMRAADLDLFKAMNSAGAEGETYQWVVAIIKLQRPAVAGIALATWAWSHTWGVPHPDIDNFAAVIGFYLFGERTLLKTKQQFKG